MAYPPVHRNGDSNAKRPFSSAGIAALLNGGADRELSDAMRVAALTGMRLDEIYNLTVADCAWRMVPDPRG